MAWAVIVLDCLLCLQWQVKHICIKIAGAKKSAALKIFKMLFLYLLSAALFLVPVTQQKLRANCRNGRYGMVLTVVYFASFPALTLRIVSILKHSISF